MKFCGTCSVATAESEWKSGVSPPTPKAARDPALSHCNGAAEDGSREKPQAGEGPVVGPQRVAEWQRGSEWRRQYFAAEAGTDGGCKSVCLCPSPVWTGRGGGICGGPCAGQVAVLPARGRESPHRLHRLCASAPHPGFPGALLGGSVAPWVPCPAPDLPGTRGGCR